MSIMWKALLFMAILMCSSVKEKAVAMEYFAVAAEGLALRPALSKSTRQRKAF